MLSLWGRRGWGKQSQLLLEVCGPGWHCLGEFVPTSWFPDIRVPAEPSKDREQQKRPWCQPKALSPVLAPLLTSHVRDQREKSSPQVVCDRLHRHRGQGTLPGHLGNSTGVCSPYWPPASPRPQWLSETQVLGPQARVLLKKTQVDRSRLDLLL